MDEDARGKRFYRTGWSYAPLPHLHPSSHIHTLSNQSCRRHWLGGTLRESGIGLSCFIPQGNTRYPQKPRTRPPLPGMTAPPQSNSGFFLLHCANIEPNHTI